MKRYTSVSVEFRFIERAIASRRAAGYEPAGLYTTLRSWGRWGVYSMAKQWLRPAPTPQANTLHGRYADVVGAVPIDILEKEMVLALRLTGDDEAKARELLRDWARKGIQTCARYEGLRLVDEIWEK